MNRYNDLLNGVKQSLETVEAAQKTYMGKKRSELKDSDFLFPETRSFPIVSPSDIPDAISNFGRMKGGMSYDAFLKKLYNMAKRKGPEFVAALPKATKDKLGLKANEITDVYPEIEYQDDRLSLISEDEVEEPEAPEELEETPEMEMKEEMDEYKQDFYEMSLGSIKSIMTHAYNILQALDNPSVKNNLTESWLQGKIAITEDYMTTIHNFVMFGPSETDTEGSEKKKLTIKDLPLYRYQKRNYPGVTTPDSFSDANKPGLWENIRKKKEKMGKNYKPAKPGDKDRPDPDAWKSAQK